MVWKQFTMSTPLRCDLQSAIARVAGLSRHGCGAQDIVSGVRPATPVEEQIAWAEFFGLRMLVVFLKQLSSGQPQLSAEAAEAV